ncbi:MAG: WecB/TagA/CpsF family glycosyltransferase [Chitinophagaceae bacterium]
MKKELLLDFPISIGKYQEFLTETIRLVQQKKSTAICVANVHMYIEAHKSEKFLGVINNAEVITPDGQPLTWALRFLYGIKQERVAGMDLLPDLLKQIEAEKISAYFYGGTKEILDRTKEYLNEKFPQLNIAGLYSPPFLTYDQISAENTNQEIIEKINSSVPSIVFVSLGCPKQEKWMSEMKGKINTVMIGIGGALPVMIGMKKRAPKWMQASGLEWLYRMMQEPNRLFLRYLTTNFTFIWIILKNKFLLLGKSSEA